MKVFKAGSLEWSLWMVNLEIGHSMFLCWEDKLKNARERMADWFVLGFAIAIIPLYIFGIIGKTMVIRIVHKTREMHTTKIIF